MKKTLSLLLIFALALSFTVASAEEMLSLSSHQWLDALIGLDVFSVSRLKIDSELRAFLMLCLVLDCENSGIFDEVPTSLNNGNSYVGVEEEGIVVVIPLEDNKMLCYVTMKGTDLHSYTYADGSEADAKRFMDYMKDYGTIDGYWAIDSGDLSKAADKLIDKINN